MDRLKPSPQTPQELLMRWRSRLAESKERKTIQSLPPVILRLFGDIDYEEQLVEIPEKFREKTIILTTSDTPDNTLISIRSKGWTTIRSKEVASQNARDNSSLLLNEGIIEARRRNDPYVFFLSSGFQRQLGVFYSMLDGIQRHHPNQDAYYFILPETHTNLSLQAHEQVRSPDLDEFLLQGFPYETALVMKTTMPFFETRLSKKGELGKSSDGIPLGGMEFFLTQLDTYRKYKERGEIYAPRMTGITYPVLTRANSELMKFYRDTNELPPSYLDSLSLSPSLEVTPTPEKIARRLATIHAAMNHLGLEEKDIRNLFSRTEFSQGWDKVARFHNKDMPAI